MANTAEIIERVAQAIWSEMRASDDDAWDQIPEALRANLRRYARAAYLATLDGIREPSDAMLVAGMTARYAAQRPVTSMWEAMIDAHKRAIAG
jgi:hypothetical protein